MDALERMISQATKKTPERIKTTAEIAAEKKAREEEEREEEELEKKCELWCSKICRIGIVVPLIFSYVLHPLGEVAMRPRMLVDTSINLAGRHAIVTGGCSGIGLQVATLLAESGANVVVGCRDGNSVETAKSLRILKAASSRWSKENNDYSVRPPMAISLQLDRLSSVRSFAQQYTDQVGKLHVLVNNAGTRQACSTSEDGIEISFQANYLGHFLLTKLLLPTLRHSSPARIVHVLCREGYLRPAHGWNHWFSDGWLQGWLGMSTPISEGIKVGSHTVDTKAGISSSEDAGETGHAAIDDDDGRDDDYNEDGEYGRDRPRRSIAHSIDWSVGCRTDRAYSNSKLAVLTFSHELERRLRKSFDSEGVVSHVINPNTVATAFSEKGSPASHSSQWSYDRIMSYFPPVWIARQIFGFLHSRASAAMIRSVEHGALGVFHVATSDHLAGAGGGLFDDTESAFTGCGRPPHKCGRVARAWQPSVSFDKKAVSQLWEISEDLVRDHSKALVK